MATKYNASVQNEWTIKGNGMSSRYWRKEA